MLPYGSTHPAPPLPRILETAYYEDIIKPVHKATNPRKHRTRNTNWRARLKLKQNDDCLSEELQSSVRPGPRCGQVGSRRLKSELFNRYVIVGNSEAFGVAIKKSRVRWHMIVLSIIARRRAQSVAVSISWKIREKDATGSRKKRLGYNFPIGKSITAINARNEIFEIIHPYILLEDDLQCSGLTLQSKPGPFGWKYSPILWKACCTIISTSMPNTNLQATFSLPGAPYHPLILLSSLDWSLEHRSCKAS